MERFILKDVIKLINEIEALLFASGEKLSFSELSEILEVNEAEIKESITALDERYRNCAIQLVVYDDYIQMATKPEFFEVISKLSEIKFPKLLTDAQLETLSVIAYKQPVTKTEIEKLRGVRSDKVIKNLIERNLIMETGKLEQPGTPILYGTTSEFLKMFGFESLDDLPNPGFVRNEELNSL